MISAKSRITQQKLDRALADIRQNVTEARNWQQALTHLSSIKDFSMGEERFCSSREALEHCDRIKAMLPETAPDSASQNIESIAGEIRELQKLEIVSDPVSLVFPILMIIALVVVAYFLFFP